ncbi:MAG TPA: transcriptional regulator [Desulfovibrio sp.]|jgi:predicted transcriptional regulator|nr:transcriptional regulator [Desulfovibrio sp.]
MDDMFKEALELVKAQATVRAMTADEMTSMVSALAKSLQALSQPVAESAGAAPVDAAKADSAKSIREAAVTCLECGKVFKIITAKHLALHGLDADAYREKWGLKKGTPLACKALVRARRKKMKEMQLWERRRSAAGSKPKAAEAAPAALPAPNPAKSPKPKAKGRPKKA